MSYEQGTDASTRDLPNPYSFDNALRIVLGVVMLIGALALIWLARGRVISGLRLEGLFLVLGGVFGLWQALTFFMTAFSQLRFYFGRNRPEDLAPNLSGEADAVGGSRQAEDLKDIIRKGVLAGARAHGCLEWFVVCRHAWFAARAAATALVH